MPLVPGWDDLALRLALTILAGIVIGLNRGEHGQSAGLRTTLLVGLAAAVAMIQVNLLLGMVGKTPDSFVTNDLMRLPLGILSGIGFIGAGAILRRGDTIQGVTTAATLWMMTVIGLSFGGGQEALGVVATALAFLVLWALKHVERRMPHEMRATLAVELQADLSVAADITAFLASHQCRAKLQSAEVEDAQRRLCFDVRWHEPAASVEVAALLAELRATTGADAVKWLNYGAPTL